jgi:hypothetical protein
VTDAEAVTGLPLRENFMPAPMPGEADGA